jgi:hypothetical protein
VTVNEKKIDIGDVAHVEEKFRSDVDEPDGFHAIEDLSDVEEGEVVDSDELQ